MFSQDLVHCFSLPRLAGFLPDVLLSRHVALDFHGFAASMPYSDIAAFRSVIDRNACYLRLRSGDNEQSW